MIRELIITDKDVRGKYRNHEYSQHIDWSGRIRSGTREKNRK